jgi:hypothetical protein
MDSLKRGCSKWRKNKKLKAAMIQVYPRKMPHPAVCGKNVAVAAERRKNNHHKSSVCLIIWQAFFYGNFHGLGHSIKGR